MEALFHCILNAVSAANIDRIGDVSGSTADG